MQFFHKNRKIASNNLTYIFIFFYKKKIFYYIIKMSSAAFTTFSANSATIGGAVTCSWTFNSSLVTTGNAKTMYIYVTDACLNDTSVELAQTHAVPLIVVDPDGGPSTLLTQFTIPGLTNGISYLFSAEITVKPTLIPSSSRTTVYNSATVSATPNTEPGCPFFALSQIEDYSFSVQLSSTPTTNPTAPVTTPTEDSAFDGYSELTGVYVVYSNGTSIRTEYFANDASTNVYTDILTVDVSDGYYEVAVSTENISADGTYRRSCLSAAQYIFVDEEPGPPQDVSAIQQIVVDPSGIPPHMLITWTAPSFVGNPPVDSYWIYRSLDTSYVFIADVSATDLSFVDTAGTDQLVPGTYYTYEIYSHNTDGLSNDPGTSNSVLAWTYPYQVNNLELINTSATSLLAQWDISENITGLPDEDLLYELILTDASGTEVEPTVITADLSYNFNGLVVGDQYFLTVYAGVTYNGFDYFNPVAPATTSNYAHGFPNPVTDLTLQNISATQLNATWLPPSDLPIDGLTQDPSGYYTVYIDASFVATTNATSQPLDGLTENETYTVRVYANYIITGTSIPIQSVPATATGAPHGAPPLSVLVATATNNLGAGGTQEGQTVLLNWTLDASYEYYTTSTQIWRQITDTSNGAIVTDPSFQLIATLGNYDASYIDQDQGDASSVYFVNGNLMTYYVLVTYTDTGFSPTSTYPVTSNDAYAIPYSQPTDPSNLIVDSQNQALELFWDLSYNSEESGLEFQYYKMYLNHVFTGDTTTNTHFTFNDLSNNVTYIVGVAAVYNVGTGGPPGGTTTESNESSVSGTPHATPFPGLSVTATNNLDNGNQRGRTLILNWNVETVPGYTNATDIWRQISGPDGNVLSDPSFQLIATLPTGVDTFRDDASLNISNVNFLNGNEMTYYVDISYVDTSNGDIFTVRSLDDSAIPYARPIPCDVSGNPVDLSLCIVPLDLDPDGTFSTFKTTVSKNGRNISTFVAVGIATDTSAPVIVYSETQLNDIIYDNIQNNGVCAENQVAQITLQFQTALLVPVRVTDVLDVISNFGGTLVAAYPQDGAFNIES